MVFDPYLLQMAKTKKNGQGKSCLSRGPLSSLKLFTIIKKTPCISNFSLMHFHKKDCEFFYYITSCAGPHLALRVENKAF